MTELNVMDVELLLYKVSDTSAVFALTLISVTNAKLKNLTLTHSSKLGDLNKLQSLSSVVPSPVSNLLKLKVAIQIKGLLRRRSYTVPGL
jgi:hypothetical protein